jgi:diacylglycerol kinase family enzyme
MEVILIVNPFASEVTEARVRAVERELGRAGTVQTLLTERPGHGAELAAAAGGDAVVVYSGDGGFNEVLNGIAEGVPLGFLPGGRTSVLPRALGLPRNATIAAQRVAEALASTAAASRSRQGSASTPSSCAASTRWAGGRTASGRATWRTSPPRCGSWPGNMAASSRRSR